MKKLIMSIVLMLVLALFSVVVSAAPVISSTVPDQEKWMNAPEWTVDLSAYESGDAGEVDADLDWNFGGGDASLFTMSMDANENIITFSPVADAAGSAVVNLFLTNGTPADDVMQSITVTLKRPATLDVSDLVLGGDNQLRSNPEADTESKEVQKVTGTLSITNSGDEDANALTVDQVLVLAGFNAEDLNITVDLNKDSLAAGESATATVSAEVPKYLDAVNSALNEVAMNIGSIKFSASGAQAGAISTTSLLTMQAKNQLVFDDVDIDVDGEVTGGSDDKNIDGIKPGDTITVSIDVKSKYRDSDNVDIEDVVITLRSDDLDVDEEEDVGDMSPKDTESVSFEFDIDDDQNQGTYTVDIKVSGVDENGALHGESWILNFEVEREKREIKIVSVTLSPSAVECGDSTDLKVKMRNIGTKDDDQVALYVTASDLEFGKVLNDLSLDKDDERIESFTIKIPEDTKPGNYRIEVKTYHQVDKPSDAESLILAVNSCDEEPEDLCSDVSCGTNTKVCADGFVATCDEVCSSTTGNCVTCEADCTGHDLTGITGDVVADGDEEEEAKGGFMGSPWYVAVLVLLNVFIVAIGAVVIVKLLRK